LLAGSLIQTACRFGVLNRREDKRQPAGRTR
jgi:hypothetical protein